MERELIGSILESNPSVPEEAPPQQQSSSPSLPQQPTPTNPNVEPLQYQLQLQQKQQQQQQQQSTQQSPPSRSTSAPPSVVPDHPVTPDPTFDPHSQEYRLDPSYHAYYYSQKPLDPRLPPPIFAWNWTSTNANANAKQQTTTNTTTENTERGGGSPTPERPTAMTTVHLTTASNPAAWAVQENSSESVGVTPTTTNVSSGGPIQRSFSPLQMIQQDFPSTPSSVLAKQQAAQRSPVSKPRNTTNTSASFFPRGHVPSQPQFQLQEAYEIPQQQQQIDQLEANFGAMSLNANALQAQQQAAYLEQNYGLGRRSLPQSPPQQQQFRTAIPRQFPPVEYSNSGWENVISEQQQQAQQQRQQLPALSQPIPQQTDPSAWSNVNANTNPRLGVNMNSLNRMQMTIPPAMPMPMPISMQMPMGMNMNMNMNMGNLGINMGNMNMNMNMGLAAGMQLLGNSNLIDPNVVVNGLAIDDPRQGGGMSHLPPVDQMGSVQDFVGRLFEMAQDQNGSRFIQQKLETASLAEKQLVFDEIYPRALQLMNDVFGNYVIQKFFEYGTEDQRASLARSLAGNVLTLSLQMYGCRVIQKALESVPLELQIQIARELDGNIIRCVKDQNGNHCIQKCVEVIEPNSIQFIVDSFEGQVLQLAAHPYGCRVIQRILEHGTANQTGHIIEELLKSSSKLVQDQYGNYVIQHVLERGQPKHRSFIIGQLHGQFVQLSTHKFASNVVEKCVAFCTPQEREAILSEFVGPRNDGAPLLMMVKDQYANYVVQKVLDIADEHTRELLLSKIRPHVQNLKKFTYGKHIIARMEKYGGSAPVSPSSSPPPGASGSPSQQTRSPHFSRQSRTPHS